jgi:hypothetical protein
MLSMLFSTVGVGFVMYAKKAEKLVAGIAGAILIVVPYLISNNYVLVPVCLVLIVLPFIFRDL